MKGECKREIEEDTEICGSRDWVDDGCFMNQDEICRKKSPGRKDNTFCLKHVVFEVFVWHLNISTINNISYIKKIAWVF